MSHIDFTFNEATQINYDRLNDQNLSQSSLSSQSTDSIQTINIWNFSYGVFQKQRLTTILKQIQQAFVQHVQLGANQNQKISFTISHINFPFLKTLNLQTNHIKSIQNFQFLKVPSLKELILKNNHITCLRVFNKLKWENLQTLDLQKNLITDLCPFAFAHFKKLKNIFMQSENDEKISESLLQLTKLSTQRLSQIKCASRKRIVKENTFYQIRNRFQRRLDFDNNQQQNAPQNINNQNFTFNNTLTIYQRKKLS